MQLSLTLILIIITTIVSISGFSNQKVIADLIFYPPAVSEQKQWYRFFTCGFIHADFGHLAFNMLALYFFGDVVEEGLKLLYGKAGGVVYMFLYLSALMVSILPTYLRHKHNYSYRSLGASGAVSAVVFAGLVLYPSAELFIFFIPIPIPGFIFAPLYLLISFWLDKKGGGNINHSAHLWGSLYGAAFIFLAGWMTGFPVIRNFTFQVQDYLRAKGWLK